MTGTEELENFTTGVADAIRLKTGSTDAINPQDFATQIASIETGGGSSGSSAYPEVNHGTADTTFQLTPNTLHVWDEVSELSLTLGAETSGVANEYLFQFTSGSTATTLTLPSDIKFTSDLTVEANKIYQISILKGLASVLEWDNEVISGLIDNLCFLNGDYVTFQYPVASDVTVYVGESLSMAEQVIVASGTPEVNCDALAPGSIILLIEPSSDNTYNYIF